MKKSVFSQVKKNESALERIRGYQGEMQIHLGKMEVCQIFFLKNAIQGKPIKFPKKKNKKQKTKKAHQVENPKERSRQKLEQKKKRELARLKT